jgi:hypothetical protein
MAIYGIFCKKLNKFVDLGRPEKLKTCKIHAWKWWIFSSIKYLTYSCHNAQL